MFSVDNNWVGGLRRHRIPGGRMLWGADNHTHSFSVQSTVNAGGDSETIPRNYTVNFFIKIEN